MVRHLERKAREMRNKIDFNIFDEREKAEAPILPGLSLGRLKTFIMS